MLRHRRCCQDMIARFFPCVENASLATAVKELAILTFFGFDLSGYWLWREGRAGEKDNEERKLKKRKMDDRDAGETKAK